MKISFINDGEVAVYSLLIDLFGGKCDEVSITDITPQIFLNMITKLGAIDNDDYDFNGWECDYSYSVAYDNKTYRVNGSAWYGNITISKED